MKKKIIVSTLFLTIIGSSQAMSWDNIGRYFGYASTAYDTLYDTLLGGTWKKAAAGTLLLAFLTRREYKKHLSFMQNVKFIEILPPRAILIAGEYGKDPKVTNEEGLFIITVKNAQGERIRILNTNFKELTTEVEAAFERTYVSRIEEANKAMDDILKSKIDVQAYKPAPKVAEKQPVEVQEKDIDDKIARKKALQQEIAAMENDETWKFFHQKNFKGDRLAVVEMLKTVDPKAQAFMKRYDDLQEQLKALA